VSVFTIKLGDLRETGYDVGLGEGSYPIFDEAYRPILNQMIFDHFEMREIGQETPRLFKKFLNRKMREIMPYYNELYMSQRIVFDPINTQQIHSETTNNTTRNQSASENSTAESANTNESRTLVSSTPQTQMTNHEDYASGLSDNAGKGDTSTSGETMTTSADEMLNTYIHDTSGYSSQSPSDALIKFRMTFINVNLMVLGELETLFMGLWDNQIGGM